MIWQEVKQFNCKQLEAERWSDYMVDKGIVLNYVYRSMFQGRLASTAGMTQQAEEGLVMIIDQISLMVQVRFFLLQMGLWKEDIEDEETEEKVQNLTSTPGSVEDAPWDASKVQEGLQPEKAAVGDELQQGVEEATTKGGKRSYYEGFFVVKAGHQKEKEIEEIQAADWAAAQQLTTCRGGMNRFECLREDEEAMEELAGLRPMTPEREVAWQEEIEQAMEMDEISSMASCSEALDESNIAESEMDDELSQESALNVSDHTVSSGKSFYADFFAKKKSCVVVQGVHQQLPTRS